MPILHSHPHCSGSSSVCGGGQDQSRLRAWEDRPGNKSLLYLPSQGPWQGSHSLTSPLLKFGFL